MPADDHRVGLQGEVVRAPDVPGGEGAAGARSRTLLSVFVQKELLHPYLVICLSPQPPYKVSAKVLYNSYHLPSCYSI